MSESKQRELRSLITGDAPAKVFDDSLDYDPFDALKNQRVTVVSAVNGFFSVDRLRHQPDLTSYHLPRGPVEDDVQATWCTITVLFPGGSYATQPLVRICPDCILGKMTG